MGLYDAMNASVTGMNAQSNYLANIGQNISNASTVGYKQADTQFSTLVDQAAVGQTSAGGVASATRLDVSRQGTLESSTSSTDLAVSGNGFFVVSDSGGQQYLTRAGSFVPDASGNLVNAGGYYLNGYSLANGPPTIVSNSLTGMEVVNINGAGLSATATTSGTLTANLPSTDSRRRAGQFALGQQRQPRPIAKRPRWSCTTTSGRRTPSIFTWRTPAQIPGRSPPSTMRRRAPRAAFPIPPARWRRRPSNFSAANGQLTSGSPLSIAVPGGATMSLDLSGMTQLAGSFAVSASTVNGNAPASVSSVTIGTDGTLSYQLSNGSTVAGYKIPLANVASPDNLLPVTGNAYSANILSGQPSVGTAGTGGLGTIKSSELEQSTVDIATELTNMIVAQRGYQANAQVFKAGADLLSSLIQMNLV